MLKLLEKPICCSIFFWSLVTQSRKWSSSRLQDFTLSLGCEVVILQTSQNHKEEFTFSAVCFIYKCCGCCLVSHVWLSVAPWTAAHPAPLSPWDPPAEHPGVGCHPPSRVVTVELRVNYVMCSPPQWWTAPTQAWWKTLFVTSTRASPRVLSMEWLLYISARGASTCWDLLPSPAWQTACGIALCPSVWVSGVVWPWKNTANTHI